MAKKWTMVDIRAANVTAGYHFFDRDMMKCFGDTVTSFAVKHCDGKVFLRRVRPMSDRSIGHSMDGVGGLREFDPDTCRIGPVIRVTR